MISVDFEYYQPNSIEEALQMYKKLSSQQKKTMYYGGGTEIISRSRINEIDPQAIIDLKNIPDCNILKKDKDNTIIGSMVSLSDIVDNPLFPLLSHVARSIAFRTARNKITIGGNISGHTFYREALLPFLLSDSIVVIAGQNGVRNVEIHQITNNGTKIKDGEFIVQIITKSEFAQHPFYNHKTTKQSQVNYPIVSIASMKVDDQIRIAFSGVCSFPFRLKEIEGIINHPSLSSEKKIQMILEKLPHSIINDLEGSMEYREFVLKQELYKLIDNEGEYFHHAKSAN